MSTASCQRQEPTRNVLGDEPKAGKLSEVTAGCLPWG